MGSRGRRPAAVAAVIAFLVFVAQAPAVDQATPSPPKAPEFGTSLPAEVSVGADSIGATVIHPVRSANVGTEVAGVIEAFKYDDGDKVLEGEDVVEVSKERYAITARESAERLKTLELALKRAEDELKVKRAVYAQEATTLQEVLRAEAELEVIQAKIAEARQRLELDRLNERSCTVKAPFSGYLAVRYKQPFETVDRLEKLFALVDCSKVYAVANIPEHFLPKFKKGNQAVFEHSSGKRFMGTVEKVGTLIDPKSGTMKVFVLIDNSSEDLRIGTTGRLEIPK